MQFIAFFAFLGPCLVLLVVCLLGAIGDRVNRKRFGIHDLFVLMTIAAITMGVVAAAIQYVESLR